MSSTNINVTRLSSDGIDAELLLGVRGERGTTAYEYAVEGGYTGTEAQFQTLLSDLTELENPTATASTLAAGSSATASYSDGEFSFGIPKGDKGDKGDTGNTGSAATVAVGSVTTGGEGTSASVTNSGTSSAAVFDFTIPKGDTGDAAGFGTVTATADLNVGTPSVTVTPSGDDTAKNFAFAFHNLGYDDSDLQSDFTTLQGQFDTAVAALTVDSEVADIRVGDDGVTYNSAGAAVRTQFSDVKADISPNHLYVQSGTIDSSGNVLDSTTSIRTGFFRLTGSLTITTATGYSTRLCVYNLDHSINDIRGFQTTAISISSTKRLFRLVIKKTDGSDISADEFSTAITTDFSSCEFLLPVSDISSSVMQLNENMPSELKAFIKSNTLFVDRCVVASGVDQDSETTLTSGFFSISSSVSVSVPSGYELRVLWYNKDYSFRQAPSWTTSASITDKNYLYRISIRKTGQTRIDYSDFKSKLVADFSGCEFFLPTREIETVLLRNQSKIADVEVNKYSLNEVMTGKDNMIWSWWYAPLAVSFKRVRDKLYWGYTTHDGFTGIAEFDFETKTTIKNNLKKADVDDHNALAVYVLPDGTVICAYAGGHNTDSKMHIRISETPESIEHFSKDIELSSSSTTSYGQFIFFDDTLYLFYRVGNTKWACRTSSDNGETWTAEKVIVDGGSLQYYCKFTETTIDGLIRICMYSNPSSTDSNIRMGFIDLSTGNIYNADNTTLLGTQGISYLSFDIIIPNETDKTQRLFDVAITAPENPLVLYAPFTTSVTSDSVYKLYDSGTTVVVCNGGESLWQPKYQLGGAFIGTDKIVTSRGYSGQDLIEIYDYSNGTATLNKLVYQETRGSVGIRNARPIADVNGKGFLWHRGYYNPSLYTDFNTDAKVYLIDSDELI